MRKWDSMEGQLYNKKLPKYKIEAMGGVCRWLVQNILPTLQNKGYFTDWGREEFYRAKYEVYYNYLTCRFANGDVLNVSIFRYDANGTLITVSGKQLNVSIKNIQGRYKRLQSYLSLLSKGANFGSGESILTFNFKLSKGVMIFGTKGTRYFYKIESVG